ncbi:hypothetical protein M408DRAFT_326668 [Serendipita vermifera MAFF 305830]|uniref:Ribosomal RNA-processing protein 17 n=1 Tax=Serendipita vermifera MAFF 305830 TaxID=933852 RepID=A0A0C3B850_SERVB|nr:hypothetical protein M408DRAFT_326668 [Serendipita vermifera MAFF 305830]
MSKKGISNISLLTHENKIWAAKKKQKKEQVKEVVFDEDSRREFLTGFRKRKLARQEAGKAKAIERERQGRLEARREKRKELAERARENARAVESAYAGNTETGDFDASTPTQQAQPEEMEFENEEQLATVTVVEDFDAVDLKLLSGVEPAKEDKSTYIPPPTKTATSRVQTSKSTKKLKPTKPKFRYETKAATKREKTKQRAKREERAKRKNGRR